MSVRLRELTEVCELLSRLDNEPLAARGAFAKAAALESLSWLIWTHQELPPRAKQYLEDDLAQLRLYGQALTLVPYEERVLRATFGN